MTYLEFLALFLVPPILLVVGLERGRLPRSLLWQLGAVATLAIVYTAPWDRVLIVERVWTYPAARVLGTTVLRVPLEEYGFYVLQVALAGLVAAAVLRRWGARG
ncbi:MAG TPA: lycopene cyclase domain-containing protein [Candidatus Dormibacteraeota bacterium]|nr:lycopene cyclase domain-containing protein [Candidatus Dormibacteraeota bacterium]